MESVDIGQKYIVTREFLDGNLKGKTHTSITYVKYDLGEVIGNPIGGGAYKIIKIEPIHKYISSIKGE